MGLVLDVIWADVPLVSDNVQVTRALVAALLMMIVRLLKKKKVNWMFGHPAELIIF